MNTAEEVSPIIAELERCKPWIEAALERSTFTHNFEDIVNSILTQEMQLWSGENGCAVTMITVYPRKKIFHIFLAGGNLDQILDFEESMIEFGRNNGCTALTLTGRVGWSKVLKERDWHSQFLTVKKEI